ncbi:MAG: hypothetical protein QM650_01380 [Microlunatus sp.]
MSTDDMEAEQTPESPEPGGDLLAWGVVANVSRDVFIRQYDDKRRPGTRHFVPGAKVWVLPIRWGDGGDSRYVIGMRRHSGGQKLIRIVMPSNRLVNYRLKGIYSPKVYDLMAHGWNRHAMSHQDRERVDIGLYDSKEEAERTATDWKWAMTRETHLHHRPGTEMHRADEDCEFCDGRDAYLADIPLPDNPHEDGLADRHGSSDWRESPHGLWAAGWRSESQMSSDPYDDDDLMIRNLTDTRRRLRSQAEHLARLLQGKTVEQIESDGQLRNDDATARYIHGDYQPRRLDGVVHAWLDDADVVVRTQFG